MLQVPPIGLSSSYLLYLSPRQCLLKGIPLEASPLLAPPVPPNGPVNRGSSNILRLPHDTRAADVAA
ncbi:hypothetical protein ACSSS7_006972 [Eimeria intestinalis]